MVFHFTVRKDLFWFEIRPESCMTQVYDLYGRQVNADADHLPRGIYIIGGRKVVR